MFGVWSLARGDEPPRQHHQGKSDFSCLPSSHTSTLLNATKTAISAGSIDGYAKNFVKLRPTRFRTGIGLFSKSRFGLQALVSWKTRLSAHFRLARS